MTAHARTAVIVVTFNSETLLPTLLSELDALLRNRLVQCVVVVDNASADRTAAAVRTWSDGRPAVTFLPLDRNIGFPRAVNVGLRETPAVEVVVLINPDTAAFTDAFTSCVDVVASNDGVGIAGPTLVGHDGRVQPESARPLPGATSMLLAATGLGRVAALLRGAMLQRTRRYGPQQVPVPAVCGAFMAVDRQLLADGLDERLFMYLEDAELCLRARRHHQKVVWLPGATVVHAQGATRDTVTRRANELDYLIGEVRWLLADDAGHLGRRTVVTAAAAILGIAYVCHPTKSSDTGRALLRWSVSRKPMFVGWRPSFAE